jgi:hypothetical protein
MSYIFAFNYLRVIIELSEELYIIVPIKYTNIIAIIPNEKRPPFIKKYFIFYLLFLNHTINVPFPTSALLEN